jgi:uncharacterized membrane protein HdeD (DUF308 family)
MAAGMRGDPADAVARVGRHWGWVLAFGIITLVIGIVALVWPGRTLLVVAVLFGIQLIVMGIFRFVAAFASEDVPAGRGRCSRCWACCRWSLACTRRGMSWSPCWRWR